MRDDVLPVARCRLFYFGGGTLWFDLGGRDPKSRSKNPWTVVKKRPSYGWGLGGFTGYIVTDIE